MVLMILVSLWATFDINISLPKVSGIVLGLGIFLALARTGQNPRGWWISFLFFLVAGFGIAALGMLGTKWMAKIAILTPIISRLAPRIIGLPGAEEGFHPNTVAGALLWVIPSFFVFSGLLLTKSKDVRSILGRGRTVSTIVLTIGATLWVMAILLLTQSRDGYISLAMTLPVLFIIALPRRLRWYGLALLVLLAICLGILLSSQWGTIRVNQGNGLSLDSIKGRMEVWASALYGIRDFPLTGMGMNTFRKVMPVLYPMLNISQNIDIGHAHNEFLQAALDLGIPGLIAFIALYVIAFWMLIQTWQCTDVITRLKSNKECTVISPNKPGMWFRFNATLLPANEHLIRMAVLGLGGGLLAHMLWGMIDAMALGSRPAFLYWIILGLISGLYQQVQECIAVERGYKDTANTKNGLLK
jgi:putative inorganic carbon (HCO3(-)) transporter